MNCSHILGPPFPKELGANAKHLIRRCVPATPSTDVSEDGDESDRFFGQGVDVILLMRRIVGLRKEPFLDKPLQMFGENAGGDAFVLFYQLPEIAPAAEDHVPKDEEAPAIAEHLKREIDRAARSVSVVHSSASNKTACIIELVSGCASFARPIGKSPEMEAPMEPQTSVFGPLTKSKIPEGQRMNRRRFLALTAVTPALPTSVAAIAQEPSKTFVLVHGAWHGGWSWGRVAEILRNDGHRVFAPTLTGLGERDHLADRVDLETHIADIERLFFYEDLQDAILVGHSYAGFVVTGAADRVAGNIAHLVYLDAFLPAPGDSFASITGLHDLAGMTGPSGGVPPLLTVEELGITETSDANWVSERLTRQPLGTFTQPVEYDTARLAAIPRSFLHTSSHFDEVAARAKAEGLTVLELLFAGHDAMVTRPRDVAKILETISRS